MKRALVLSLICVVGLAFAGFAQTLTGSWITTVCLNPQTDSFAGAITLASTLGVTYAIGDWAFTSTTVLTGAGWSDQDFTVTGLFGLITVSSALDFNPLPGAFGSWSTTLGLNMAGVTFGATFYIGPGTATSPVGGSRLTLTGSAGVGSAVVGDITIVLGNALSAVCDFDFQSVNIGLDFLFCDCAAIQSDIYFTCAGFQYVQFVAKGIAIPNLPWVSLDAKLKFQLQTKELTITPVFDIGAIVCFDLYIYHNAATGATFPYNSYTWTSFTVEGIGLSCDIGGVTFTALSNWHNFGAGATNLALRPGLLAGKDYKYWEVYSIGLDADACCGGVFEFDLAVFFAENVVAPATMSNLFDVALIEADMKVNVTTQFAFTMGLDVDVAGGFTKWCLGFEVTW
jgi:hypothetical protein